MSTTWPFDPYEVLGVRRGASDRAIAAAHRAMARMYHPDVAGDAMTARMMRINAAFDAIRTAQRRAAFDETAPDGTGAGKRAPSTAWDAATGGHRPWRARPAHDGTGGAGPAPGRPSGSVLDFGRHIGWSIGEVARVDPGYLEWLANRPEGRPYVAEIAAVLARVRHRAAPAPAARHSGRLSFRRG
jgi:curved DNA-binding protein CbpA